jgi:VanZ family protein
MQPDVDNRPNHLQRVAKLAWITTLVMFVAMFVGTHMPFDVSSEISHHDKMVHFWAYMTLSFSLLASWDLSMGRLQPIQYFLVWLACTTYGAIDEITQIPVGRTGDVVDWLFDAAGIIVGLTLFRVLRPLVYRLAQLVPVAG